MSITEAPVREQIVVNAPVEKAFEMFTAGIESWWPPEHHILQAELARMVFEPRVGGHIYDVASTGASRAGHGCSPTSRRAGWCSARTSR